MVKNEYKNMLMQRIMSKTVVDSVHLIKKAVQTVDFEKTKNCVTNGI